MVSSGIRGIAWEAIVVITPGQNTRTGDSTPTRYCGTCLTAPQYLGWAGIRAAPRCSVCPITATACRLGYITLYCHSELGVGDASRLLMGSANLNPKSGLALRTVPVGICWTVGFGQVMPCDQGGRASLEAVAEFA